MLKLATALMFGLTATSALAQTDPKYFTTTLECLPAEEMFTLLAQGAGQEIFAIGDVWVYDTLDNPHVGSMLMSMSFETGAWTITATYDDGMTCVVASGSIFEPPPVDQYVPQSKPKEPENETQRPLERQL